MMMEAIFESFLNQGFKNIAHETAVVEKSTKFQFDFIKAALFRRHYSACQIIKHQNQITVDEIFSYFSETIPLKALINMQQVILGKIKT